MASAEARALSMWTLGTPRLGVNSQPLTIGAQCGAVIGLHPQDDEWLSGTRMAGVWFKTQEDASLHQHAMDVVPHGRDDLRLAAAAGRRPGAQRRGEQGLPPGEHPAEVDLALGAALQADHHQPAVGVQRGEVARQVLRAHVVEHHVGAASRLHDLNEVLVAVVDRGVGTELAAQVELGR